MIELELLGPDPEGTQVVFTDAEGQRYRVAINSELRAAVRREQPQLSGLPPQSGPLRPRAIQQLLRAGASAVEISTDYGIDLEQVQVFEGPIIAERDYAASSARRIPVGKELDSPRLGDLVIDRLAARGVDPDSITWDACRKPGQNWQVIVTFVQSALEKQATWELDAEMAHISAVDQEAKWLSETTAPAGDRLSFLSDYDSRGGVDPGVTPPQSFLDELDASRGIPRNPAEDEQFLEELMAEEDGTVLSASTVDEAEEPATVTALPVGEAPAVLPGLESVEELEQTSVTEEKSPARKTKRRSVPSWDEIVFGSKR